MSIRRISPKEAANLVQTEGYAYVDVRSEVEFEQARPAGSVNVPLLHKDAAGAMVPNPSFLAAMRSAFPPGSKFVIGCQGGVRSMKAAQSLVAHEGYAEIVEQRCGFGGARDPGGAIVEEGWQASGLPVEQGPAPGRDWASVKSKL